VVAIISKREKNVELPVYCEDKYEGVWNTSPPADAFP